jgi:hypothetical protein
LGFLVMNAGTIVLVYLLGKRLFTPMAGVVASASYALLSVGEGVLGTQAHATHFVVAAALGGTLLLLRATGTKRSTPLLWSGLLYGVAILMKQHAVLFVLFAGSYVIWDHRTRRVATWPSTLRDLLLLIFGVSIPLTLTGLALWRAGVFQKFWFWTVTYASLYVQGGAGGFDAFASVFPGVVGPNAAIWTLALAGLVLIWRKNRDRATAAFATGFLVFSSMATSVGFYFREHYFVLMLPAIALLSGAAVSAASKRWPGASRWIYGLCGAVLVLSVLQQQDFLFQTSPIGISRTMYGPNPFLEAVQIGEYIRAHSAKGSRIAVLGSEPEIFFYADRRSATGHIYMYNLTEDQPYALTMQEEMIRDLESTRPDYVVVVTTFASWLRTAKSPSRIFDWWERYCEQRYKIEGAANIYAELPPDLKWGDVKVSEIRSQSAVMVYRRMNQ